MTVVRTSASVPSISPTRRERRLDGDAVQPDRDRRFHELGERDVATTPRRDDLRSELVGWWSAGTHNIVPASTATRHRGLRGFATPPSNAYPSISGPPREGVQLTVSSGTWAGSLPMTFEYEWQRCASNRKQLYRDLGRNGEHVHPTSADVGSRLRCTVIATNTVGSNSATSIQTGVVKRARLPGLAGASVR